MNLNIDTTLHPSLQLRQINRELRWCRISLENCDKDYDQLLIKQYLEKIKNLLALSVQCAKLIIEEKVNGI